jgi:PhnB protein
MNVQTVVPYLTCKPAEEAIAFYARAFGAEERMRLPAEDGKRLMHAELALAGGRIFLSDEMADCGGPQAPSNGVPPPVGVALDLGTPAEVDALFARAVGAGATGVMAPEDAFWGARFAMLVDPFGHRWMLNAALAQG